MAWFVAKTEMPLKTLFLSLGTLPLILPPFIGAYSWVLLFGRRGMLTVFLKAVVRHHAARHLRCARRDHRHVA